MTSRSVTPVFVLSLPRSGSTLLQRLLASHPSIATSSEPWFLLPVFLTLEDGHVYTSYQQRHYARAFADFLASLPDGAAAHRDAVRRYAHALYDGACASGETHFVDKTPRYHLIVGRLLEYFPDARFILLWRNPLAIAASCMKTWCRGRFNLYHYRVDLFHGLANLVEVQRRADERVVELRYEDLVAAPQEHLARIFEHLGVAPFAEAVERFRAVDPGGVMGDKRGAELYDSVSTESVDDWARALATPLRRRWARRYLRWLGADALATMGYDAAGLQRRLAAEPLAWRGTLSDVARMSYGWYFVKRELALFRKKKALAGRGVRVDVPSE